MSIDFPSVLKATTGIYYRVPLTPADARRAKPGEILMSLDGSPVHSNSHSRAYSFNVKQKRNVRN